MLSRIIRRPSSSIGSGVHYDNDECLEHGERDRRKDSWYIRRPKQPPKTNRESVHGVHDVIGPLPPLPNKTPRSSDSSLCSGHNEDFASQPNSLKRHRLCALVSKNGESEESLQISGTVTDEDDGPSSRPSPNSRHTNSPDLVRNSEESLVPNSYSSSSSSGEREYSLPTAEDIARRSSEHSETQKQPEEYSDNIQQLIQEADEAFKAVGDALAEVRLAKYSSNENTPQELTSEQPPMSGSFLERPGPRTPDISPILESPLRQKPYPRLNTSTLPARNPSVSKRKKSKKYPKPPKVKSPKAVKARKPVIYNKPAVRHAPRWTLTENVTELFSGRLFNRIEVDEMLTEAQLEEFKRLRQSNLKNQEAANETTAQQQQQTNETPKSSSETAETESIDTPIEPFHLEDLPSRIGSAGVKLTAETPVEEKVQPTFFDDDMEDDDFWVETDKDELFLGDESSTSGSHPAARSPFPGPPPKKSLKGLMAGRKQPPGLPSIPEASSTPRTPMDELFLDKQLGGLQDSVADSDYVYFRSSPYSITAPSFRHGPIRIAKEDLMPEPSLGGTGGDDGGLDWTAFQMAILGGAGDWNSESDDTIHRRTVEEIDELVGWWESWRFDDDRIIGSTRGLGGLLTEDPELLYAQQTPPSPTSTLSGGEYSDISYSDIKQDNPYSAHHRWQTLRRQAAVQGLGLPGPKSTYDEELSNIDYRARHSSKIYVPDPPPPHPPTKPLPLEGGQLRKFADRESLASLPQSPMLDLRVIGGPDGDDVDVVPMGYNLGHDLGDFLKWEAEHVYAYSSGDVMM